MTVGCTLRGVREEVRDATISILERTTFADIAARAGGPWLQPHLLETALSSPPRRSRRPSVVRPGARDDGTQ